MGELIAHAFFCRFFDILKRLQILNSLNIGDGKDESTTGEA